MMGLFLGKNGIKIELRLNRIKAKNTSEGMACPRPKTDEQPVYWAIVLFYGIFMSQRMTAQKK